MNLTAISGLTREAWAELTSEGRLAAIGDLERDFAAQEGREACKVTLIRAGERVTRGEEPVLRGQFDQLANEIRVDPSLLSGDRPPYQAVETYFHEARHAYQVHAIRHPEVHEDQAQLEDWRKNDAAYVNEEDLRLGLASYSHYRWQPLEADANQVARERTGELYAGQFQDESQYPSYAAQKANEISAYQKLAVNELGTDNYQEEARRFVLSRFEAQMTREQGIAESEPSQPSKVTMAAPSQEPTSVTPQGTKPSEDESQEEEYGYGHGM